MNIFGWIRSKISGTPDPPADDSSEWSPPDYANTIPEPKKEEWTATQVAEAAQMHADGTGIQFLGGPGGSVVDPRPHFAQLNFWPGMPSTSPLLVPAVEIRDPMEPVRSHEIEPLSTISGLYETGVKTVCSCRRK